MPTTRQTYVDPLLTNVSVAYKNESYIGERLFPSVTVQKETGFYFKMDKENLRAPADAERGEFDRANRVKNKMSQEAYELTERSLETPISDRVMNNYDDPFDPMSNGANLVTEKLLIDNEKDAKAKLIAAKATTDAAGAWATISTDIIGTVRTKAKLILKNTGHRPNTAMISEDTLEDGIKKNTAFIDAVKYTNTVSQENLMKALAGWLGVENVVIGSAVENTAEEGLPDSMSFIWDDLFALLYVPPTPAIETPAAGYRLVQGGARQVDRWYEQERKTSFVRVSDYFENKIVDPGAIEVIEDTITT